MSDTQFEAAHNNFVSFERAPQINDQSGDTRELSMDELDEVNGGMLLAIMAFMAGYGAVSMYYDRRGR